MNTQTRTIAFALAVALLAGCASGGGGGGTVTDSQGNTRRLSDEETLACILVIFLCPFIAGDSAAGAGSAGTEWAKFSSWTQLKRDTLTYAPQTGLTTRYTEDRNGLISVGHTTDQAGDVRFAYDAQGKPVHLWDSYRWNGANLAALGQPGIDTLSDSLSRTPFGTRALLANPYALGWDYQSFGAWNSLVDSSVSVGSFGQPTPASGVPTSGTATFTGKLAGYYVPAFGEGGYTAAANLTVNANFSSRSLGFASSGTTIARDLNAPASAPHLNLGGTLTYAPGTNAFSGTVTNASGTMSGSSNGRFYGPAAQELGGVFSLRSSTSAETFTGAYGAKR